MYKKKLWTVLTGVFSVLLAVMFIATLVANYFSTSINAFLQCDTFRIVHAEDAGDTNYYPDEWELRRVRRHREPHCQPVRRCGSEPILRL